MFNCNHDVKKAQTNGRYIFWSVRKDPGYVPEIMQYIGYLIEILSFVFQVKGFNGNLCTTHFSKFVKWTYFWDREKVGYFKRHGVSNKYIRVSKYG